MGINSVNVKTAKEWLDKGEAVIVDVREPSEYAAESIVGATLLPIGKVSKASLPDCRGKKLVLHCRRGGRGGRACEQLLAEDANLEIYNLEGGITAWAEAGLPIKSGAKKIFPLERQVQLTIGAGVLAGSLLGYFVNPQFFMLSGFFGAGLLFAGITGTCGLAVLLAKMPWNAQAEPKSFCMIK